MNANKILLYFVLFNVFLDLWLLGLDINNSKKRSSKMKNGKQARTREQKKNIKINKVNI